ncbi:MAG: protein TolR [Proteobacteria bacterium]|nr:MAG: protein TolR [Pseudomonadota bacterium]
MGAVRRGHSAMSEINVTPFVDVMLVLLIIFMVTAPMMQQGIDVDLPETSTTQPLRLDEEPLVMSVQRDGRVFLGKQEVPVGELAAKLHAVFESRGDKALYLRADREAPYGAVAKAMAAARNAGATKLGIVTEPEG